LHRQPDGWPGDPPVILAAHGPSGVFGSFFPSG
jgi:hypothetical protein